MDIDLWRNVEVVAKWEASSPYHQDVKELTIQYVYVQTLSPIVANSAKIISRQFCLLEIQLDFQR